MSPIGRLLGAARIPQVVDALTPNLSHKMYQLKGFRKSTPPQNRQLSNSRQKVDDFGGGVDFLKPVN